MSKRQIKFRAKSLKTDEWVYGTPVDVCGGGMAMITSDCERNDVGCFYTNDGVMVDEETLGQFTGLYDKDGEEIYEGDLLRFPPKIEWEKRSYGVFEVFWHDNDYCDSHIGWQMNRVHWQGILCGGSVYPFRPEYTHWMVVIGNIYDNKELLEP